MTAVLTRPINVVARSHLASNRSSHVGEATLAAALTVLVLAEIAVSGPGQGVLVGSRAIVVVTFGVLLAAAVRGSVVHSPELVALILTAAALGLDVLGAAAGIAPTLFASTASPLGLHLLAALLIGAAAMVLGGRLLAAKAPAAVPLSILGVAQVGASGAALHGVSPTACYGAVLGIQATFGAVYVLTAIWRRHR